MSMCQNKCGMPHAEVQAPHVIHQQRWYQRRHGVKGCTAVQVLEVQCNEESFMPFHAVLDC